MAESTELSSPSHGTGWILVRGDGALGSARRIAARLREIPADESRPVIITPGPRWVPQPDMEQTLSSVLRADPDLAGVLRPEVDRLTQRQLQFENVIILFAYHDVVSPTNLDIHLEQDWVGDALLFRDGRVYTIRWSTRASEAELQSGIRKPIQFYYPDDETLFPLKLGHTWVTVVTPLTAVTDQGDSQWLLQFSQPPGAK